MTNRRSYWWLTANRKNYRDW